VHPFFHFAARRLFALDFENPVTLPMFHLSLHPPG
jgi:hypothetical protein